MNEVRREPLSESDMAMLELAIQTADSRAMHVLVDDMQRIVASHRALAARVQAVERERDELKSRLETRWQQSDGKIEVELTKWDDITQQLADMTRERDKALAQCAKLESVLFGSDVVKLREQLAEAQGTIERLKETPQDPLPEFLPCGDNSYWVSAFGNCIMCRARKAERQVARLLGSLETLWKMFHCSDETPYCADRTVGNNAHFDGHWHEAREVVAEALRETGRVNEAHSQ